MNFSVVGGDSSHGGACEAEKQCPHSLLMLLLGSLLWPLFELTLAQAQWKVGIHNVNFSVVGAPTVVEIKRLRQHVYLANIE